MEYRIRLFKVDIYDKDKQIVKTIQSSIGNRHDLEWYANEYIDDNDHAVSMGAVYEVCT